jgi:hypothetical protein
MRAATQLILYWVVLAISLGDPLTANVWNKRTTTLYTSRQGFFVDATLDPATEGQPRGNNVWKPVSK